MEAQAIDIDFAIEGKKVVLIDDVLYTGRSVRAAMDALLTFGRPKSVELLVFIDRRFSRHLPIQPNYVGLAIGKYLIWHNYFQSKLKLYLVQVLNQR